MSGPWTVPSKDWRLQHRLLWPELVVALERVLLEDDPVLGTALAIFERDFASYLGTTDGVGVGNGTDALTLALMALDIGPGDEVVTAAHTYAATLLAIRRVGARPVLVDASPSDFFLDLDALEQAITPRTRAVIPVHLYGLMGDMARVMELAKRHDLRVVEDAAQAHGARLEGRAAGSFGDCGCFSFHPSKNIGAAGDGGFVACSGDELADRLRRLRDFGKSGKYELTELGLNSRLDSLQAALLSVKLKRLESWNERRRELAAAYREALADTPLVLPSEPAGRHHVFHLYVVRVPGDGRDRLRRRLAECGVRAGIHYPIPPHRQRAFADLGYSTGAFPVAERLASEILTLPLFPEMTEEQLATVCGAIQELYR